MKKNDKKTKTENQGGLYTKPLKGWSSRTNTIVGTAFLVFVIVCFIIRGFVGNKGGDNGTAEATTQVPTTQVTTTEEISSDTEADDNLGGQE